MVSMIFQLETSILSGGILERNVKSIGVFEHTFMLVSSIDGSGLTVMVYVKVSPIQPSKLVGMILYITSSFPIVKLIKVSSISPIPGTSSPRTLLLAVAAHK